MPSIFDYGARLAIPGLLAVVAGCFGRRQEERDGGGGAASTPTALCFNKCPPPHPRREAFQKILDGQKGNDLKKILWTALVEKAEGPITTSDLDQQAAQMAVDLWATKINLCGDAVKRPFHDVLVGQLGREKDLFESFESYRRLLGGDEVFAKQVFREEKRKLEGMLADLAVASREYEEKGAGGGVAALLSEAHIYFFSPLVQKGMSYPEKRDVHAPILFNSEWAFLFNSGLAFLEAISRFCAGSEVEKSRTPDNNEEAESKAERDKAKKHYLRGYRLYNQRKYRAAAADFEAGYAARPNPVFLYNLGQCYRQMRSTEWALFFYQGYLREEPGAPNRVQVERLIADLERRRSRR